MPPGLEAFLAGREEMKPPTGPDEEDPGGAEIKILGSSGNGKVGGFPVRKKDTKRP